jgi:hypothetical protein
MAKSKIVIKFLSICEQGDRLDIVVDRQSGPVLLRESFTRTLSTSGVSNTGLVAYSTSPSRAASNYYDALVRDYSGYTFLTFSYNSVLGTVTISAVDECTILTTFRVASIPIANPDTKVEPTITNEDCRGDIVAEFESAVYFNHIYYPCDKVTAEIKTTVQLATSDQFDYSLGLENPLSLSLDRGITYRMTGLDINGNAYDFSFQTPSILNVSLVTINVRNEVGQAVVDIINETNLELQYNIDNGAWQVGTTFYVPLGASYVLYVKDAYGCEDSLSFTVDETVISTPLIGESRYCPDLHELNVGKFLNLFGKQHTMKLGFVCNASPQYTKIFKHIQMILSTDYAIKNVQVKTSLKQERFVPGSHMTYRIREGMHSVPLKNPQDVADLRGSWAYIELEIESINNTKVDLFSVIMHLRKSTT